MDIFPWDVKSVPLRALRRAFHGREDEIRSNAGKSDGLVVRQVTEGDFEAVSGLLEELGRSKITPETEAATRQVFARHVADPNTASLIAELGSRPVGFLSLHFRERLSDGASEHEDVRIGHSHALSPEGFHRR